eukprot:6196384-Pleurochrysis_carterae.AAC.1
MMDTLTQARASSENTSAKAGGLFGHQRCSYAHTSRCGPGYRMCCRHGAEIIQDTERSHLGWQLLRKRRNCLSGMRSTAVGRMEVGFIPNATHFCQ